jgi:hypothetical protein
MKIELPHELFQLEVPRPTGRPHLEPSRLAFGQRLDAVAAGDLIESLAHVLDGEVMA